MAPWYTYNVVPCSFSAISSLWLLTYIGFFIWMTHLMYTSDMSTHYASNRALWTYPIKRIRAMDEPYYVSYQNNLIF